jgi:hypothetical protein
LVRILFIKYVLLLLFQASSISVYLPESDQVVSNQNADLHSPKTLFDENSLEFSIVEEEVFEDDEVKDGHLALVDDHASHLITDLKSIISVSDQVTDFQKSPFYILYCSMRAG